MNKCNHNVLLAAMILYPIIIVIITLCTYINRNIIICEPTPTPTATIIYITTSPPSTPTVTKQTHSSCGDYDRCDNEIMRVTAYDLSYASCGKSPSHPEYGITASGKRVKEWCTVAAGKNIPFGTKLYIPYFKDAPNKGIFIVQDRGGAIHNGCIDIYMSNYVDCMEFGVKRLKVYIINEED